MTYIYNHDTDSIAIYFIEQGVGNVEFDECLIHIFENIGCLFVRL